MGEFTNGLFGCFGNMGICVKAYFCPCIVQGHNAEAMELGTCMKCGLASLTPCGVYFMAKTREALRQKKDIEGSFINDCLISMICPLCSLVQVAREIDDAPSSSGQAMARV